MLYFIAGVIGSWVTYRFTKLADYLSGRNALLQSWESRSVDKREVETNSDYETLCELADEWDDN